MSTIETQSWREKSLIVEVEQTLGYSFIDSKPNYINIANYSPNELYVSRSPGVSPTSYDFTVPPMGNRQVGWSETIGCIYILNPGPLAASIRLVSYASAFDPASVFQSGDTVINGATMNIASMPNVQATILNTVPTKLVQDYIDYLILGGWNIQGPTGSTMLLNNPAGYNLKSLHMDFWNDYTGPLTLRVSIGATQDYGYRIIYGPTIPGKSAVHVDLDFGNGVDFVGGIWANADIENTVRINGGYATICGIVL